ncbi:MAG: NAD(P)H-dependent oxidoreductase subunit E [Fusobacteriaceae bacterium]
MEKEFLEKLDKFISEQSDKKNEIQILNFMLEEQGEITDEAIKIIAEKTGIWDLTIKNTINFYPKYQKKNYSKLTEIVYCNGRNCKEKTEKIIDELKEIIKFNKNGISLNGKFKLLEKRCFGQCNIGPNIEINGLLYNKINIKKLKLGLKI